MNRQAPLASRPQKQGTAVLAATWRTLKSVPGTAISSHGEVSGIVVLLLVWIVHIALHLLEPDFVDDDIDGRRVVPVREAHAKGSNRPCHSITLGLQTVNHEEGSVPHHPVMCVGYCPRSILANGNLPCLLTLRVAESEPF